MQLVTGLFVASGGDSSTDCVPAWTFAAFFSPCITMLIVVHVYGQLNLAIERDIDQDIVEMNVSEPARERESEPSRFFSNPLLRRFV